MNQTQLAAVMYVQAQAKKLHELKYKELCDRYAKLGQAPLATHLPTDAHTDFDSLGFTHLIDW